MNNDTHANSTAVVGLGAMGGRIAEILSEHDNELVLWNRDASKIAPFLERGAVAAGSFSEAVSAAEVVVVVLSTYDVFESLLDELAPDALRSRVIVNLVTGTPEEARHADARVKRLGGTYLDGGNMCYPRSIGAENAAMLYAGSQDAWDAAGPVLRPIAPAARYLGADPGIANASYLVAWNVYFAAVGAFHQTRPVARAAGLTDAAYAEAVGTTLLRLSDFLPDALDRLERGDFQDDQAAIATHAGGSRHRAQMFSRVGMPGGYADLFLSLIENAIAQDLGHLDINALSIMLAHPPKALEHSQPVRDE